MLPTMPNHTPSIKLQCVYGQLKYVKRTFPLTPREELKFSMSGNRVLRRIFGPEREEVGGIMESTLAVICLCGKGAYQLPFSWH